jgi:hypothetical protein
MNERIRLLWEEAAKTTQGDSWEEQTKFIERFAELIVRECSQMVEDKFDFCGDEIIIAEQILKHFGVEE